MVQILPPKTNLGSQIGQALGQGLQGGMQQGLQRGMLQQALGQVKNLSQKENVQPLEMMLSLMEAGAGIPGSERYLGSLLQPLMAAAQVQGMPGFGQQPTDPTQGPGGDQTQSPTTFGDQGQPPIGSPVQGQEKPINLGTFIPLNIGQLVNPEQSQNILRKVAGSGGDIKLAKTLIDDYNQGRIGFNELANANVNRAYAQKQRELSLESDIANRIGQKVGPQDPEGYKSVAYNMVKPFINEGMDFNSAWLKAEPEYNNFKREISKFESSIPKAGFFESQFGFAPEELNKWLEKGKSITNKYPSAYPILQDFFTNKGYNVITAANALNPLSSNVRSILQASTDYKPELYRPSGFGDQREGKEIEEISDKQIGQIEPFSKNISKNWNDKTSLINLYGALREKGWLPNNIHALVDNLRQKVKFSSQQEVEANEILKNPPLPLLERKYFRKK